MSLYEVAESSLGVTESSLGTSDQRHTERRLTVIDATVNALARRVYTTLAPGATAGPPFRSPGPRSSNPDRRDHG